MLKGQSRSQCRNGRGCFKVRGSIYVCNNCHTYSEILGIEMMEWWYMWAWQCQIRSVGMRKRVFE